MKKINLFVFSIASISLAFIATSSAQTCDTTPDPGQTVGKCISGSNEEGQYAACGVNYEGPICYFGRPVGEQ